MTRAWRQGFLAIVVGALPAGCSPQSPSPPSPGGAIIAPASASVREVASMQVPRAAHSATPLRDGRVLIAGGFTGGSPLSPVAEWFDPATDRFAPVEAPLAPRQSHTATLLADGRVLLAGGYGPRDDYLDSAELFDPVTGAVTAVGPMTMARAGHQAVRLTDGRVLLLGGVGTGWAFLASAELFDPATGTFASTGGMAAPRESHVALALPDGQVLVVGGHVGRREAMRLHTSIERYDPASGRFTPAGEMRVRRHKHDAVLLPDGTVLITGGADERDSDGVYQRVERYDPATGRSVERPPLARPRHKHAGTSVVLADGRVLLGGGAPEAEVYDPATGHAELVQGVRPLAGQFSTTAGLPDGSVLIAGGYGGGKGPQRSTWVYRP